MWDRKTNIKLYRKKLKEKLEKFKNRISKSIINFWLLFFPTGYRLISPASFHVWLILKSLKNSQLFEQDHSKDNEDKWRNILMSIHNIFYASKPYYWTCLIKME